MSAELQRAGFLIQRLAGSQSVELARLVHAAGLTASQYGVLAVLREEGPTGLGCNAIAGRLAARDPDMTRLLDQLAAKGLVSRARSETDRRVWIARITAAGSALLEGLDEPVERARQEWFRQLDGGRLRTLVELLETLSQ